MPRTRSGIIDSGSTLLGTRMTSSRYQPFLFVSVISGGRLVWMITLTTWPGFQTYRCRIKSSFACVLLRRVTLDYRSVKQEPSIRKPHLCSDKLRGSFQSPHPLSKYEMFGYLLRSHSVSSCCATFLLFLSADRTRPLIVELMHQWFTPNRLACAILR